MSGSNPTLYIPEENKWNGIKPSLNSETITSFTADRTNGYYLFAPTVRFRSLRIKKSCVIFAFNVIIEEDFRIDSGASVRFMHPSSFLNYYHLASNYDEYASQLIGSGISDGTIKRYYLSDSIAQNSEISFVNTMEGYADFGEPYNTELNGTTYTGFPAISDGGPVDLSTGMFIYNYTRSGSDPFYTSTFHRYWIWGQNIVGNSGTHPQTYITNHDGANILFDHYSLNWLDPETPEVGIVDAVTGHYASAETHIHRHTINRYGHPGFLAGRAIVAGGDEPVSNHLLWGYRGLPGGIVNIHVKGSFVNKGKLDMSGCKPKDKDTLISTFVDVAASGGDGGSGGLVNIYTYGKNTVIGNIDVRGGNGSGSLTKRHAGVETYGRIGDYLQVCTGAGGGGGCVAIYGYKPLTTGVQIVGGKPSNLHTKVNTSGFPADDPGMAVNANDDATEGNLLVVDINQNPEAISGAMHFDINTPTGRKDRQISSVMDAIASIGYSGRI